MMVENTNANILIAGFFGIIIPPIVDFINQKVTNPKRRYLVAIAISLLFGFVSSLITGELNENDILGSTAAAFAVSQTIYKTYWRESDLRASFKTATKIA